MEHLLTDLYPHERGYMPQAQLAYPKVEYDSPFSLSDPRACHQCKAKYPEFSDCNEQMLYIDTSTPLTVLNFEAFIQQLDNTPAGIKSRCDYLIYDEYENRSRIAFCDVTCSAAQYVDPNPGGRYPEGKRAKAYSQMRSSLEALLQVELLAITILTFPSKVALFGWRERGAQRVPMDVATTSMLDFSITPDSETQTLTSDESIMGKHFSFVQVKFPSHYNWNRL